MSDKFTALQVVWDAHKSHIGDKKTALDVLKIKLGSYDNAAATIKEGEGLIASAKTDMSRNWQLCAKNRKQQHVDMLKLKMNESVKMVTRLAGTLEQTRQGYETVSGGYQTWLEGNPKPGAGVEEDRKHERMKRAEDKWARKELKKRTAVNQWYTETQKQWGNLAREKEKSREAEEEYIRVSNELMTDFYNQQEKTRAEEEMKQLDQTGLRMEAEQAWKVFLRKNFQVIIQRDDEKQVFTTISSLMNNNLMVEMRGGMDIKTWAHKVRDYTRFGKWIFEVFERDLNEFYAEWCRTTLTQFYARLNSEERGQYTWISMNPSNEEAVKIIDKVCERFSQDMMSPTVLFTHKMNKWCGSSTSKGRRVLQRQRQIQFH